MGGEGREDHAGPCGPSAEAARLPVLRVHNKAARISLHNKARIRPHEVSGNQRLDEAIAEGASTSARLHFRPEPSHTACDGARVVCADPEKIWG